MKHLLDRGRLRLGLYCWTPLLMMAGCGDATPPAPPAEVARPVEMLEVGAATAVSDLRFPGRVRSTQRAELSFGLGGKLVELPVKEGQKVSKGTLIARIDGAAYQNRLAAAQVEFDKAQTDYDRVRTVWEQSRAVARAEVDQKRAAMEVARSTLAAARKDMGDTRLTAPFAGIIARRYVENFRDVQAREPIVSLQDPGQLEVVVHVPERIVRSQPRRAAGYALLEGLPERRLPVTLKSFATEADPQTQTYEVVLGLERPADVVVLPGMSVTVFPDSGGGQETEGPLSIPLKAVLAGPDGDSRVWVFDPGSARVSPRSVRLDAVQGEFVSVLDGLQPGEWIVTAGVHHLRDGMLVRPL